MIWLKRIPSFFFIFKDTDFKTYLTMIENLKLKNSKLTKTIKLFRHFKFIPIV